MSSYDEATYGDRIADVYDEWYEPMDRAAIEVLAKLASGGRALELGIGTGRIALPLASSGIEVHGIDASTAMVAKLRAKPGGQEIPVTMGDFAEVAVEGEFGLVFVVFTTFFSLLEQVDQIRCFANVAKHLSADGVFLVEAFVPDMTRFVGHQALRTVTISESEVRLDASLIDPVKQQIVSQHIALGENGVRLYPVRIRYAWPSEMDLMARLGGLVLRQRWGGWDRSAFTADSSRHISLYGHQA